MRCIDNIKDIILDCNYKPVRGLKHRVLVIPYKDIDRRYTILNADKTEITHLQLLPSKRGYLFELNNAFKVSGSQKFGGGFTHELSIKIDKADSGNIATMNTLTKGTYVLIVETTGNTFEILGYEAGVVVSSIQRDYASNVVGITFSTPSDVKELRMVVLWGEGDYIAMSRKFENKAFVGRNLILNSENERYKEYKGTVEDYIIYQIAGGILEKNTTYTLSLEYKGENIRSVDLFLLSNDLRNGNHKLILNINGAWKKETFTFTTSDSSPLNHLRIDNNGSDLGDVVSKLWTRFVKLEKGNIATDWCPADED